MISETECDELLVQLELHWRQRTGLVDVPFRARLREWLGVARTPAEVFAAIDKTGRKVRQAAGGRPFTIAAAVVFCGNVVRSRSGAGRTADHGFGTLQG